MKKKMILCLLFLTPFMFAADEKEKDVKVEKPKAFMGVTLKEVKEQGKDGKVFILDVFDDSAADLAGLLSEDMLLKVNGVEIKDIKEVKDILRDCLPDQDIEVCVSRGEKTKVVELKLGSEPILLHMDKDFKPLRKAFFIGEPRPYVGIEMKSLSGQLADYFGVDKGVLIEKVVEDSPAQAAGLMAGDVIIGIGDKDIASTEDILDTLESYKPGDPADFRLLRRGEAIDLSVNLEKKDLPQEFIIRGDDDDVQIHRWIDKEKGEIKIEVKKAIEKEN